MAAKREGASKADKLRFICQIEEERLNKGLSYRPDIDLIDLKYQLLKLATGLKIPEYFDDLMGEEYGIGDQLFVTLLFAMVVNYLLQLVPDSPDIPLLAVREIIYNNLGYIESFEKIPYKESDRLVENRRSNLFIQLVNDYWPNLNKTNSHYLSYVISEIYSDLIKVMSMNETYHVNQIFDSLWLLRDADPQQVSQLARHLLLNLYDSIKEKQVIKEQLSALIPTDLSKLIGEYVSKY